MFRSSVTVCVLLLCAWPSLAAQKVFDFGDYKQNEVPAGFKSTVLGAGKPGEWKILLDDAPTPFEPVSPKAVSINKRRVLAQVAREKLDEHYPLFIYQEEDFEDFVVTTQFKMVEGEQEQMAGIAFRIQDERNFFYVRASALGKSIAFFPVVSGVLQNPVLVKYDFEKGKWYELLIECKAAKIRVQVDGKDVFPLFENHSFRGGKIGFWTKSDSVSYFADTKITYTPKEVFAQKLVNEAIKNYPRLLALKMFAVPVGKTNVQMVASLDPKEIGSPASDAEKDTIARGLIYYGKGKDKVVITLPLHDSNGESVAAVELHMKSFPGQTEKNALVRALPIVKDMEKRVQSLADLTQ
ncbi:MAG: hypothetical protein JWM16_4324 [Verrucomicrobiales bacterium]|jgi:hypothetical protein|nr:hypothetical protein [Verrucomicrobiales bacterium]